MQRLLMLCTIMLTAVASANAAQACPIINGDFGMQFVDKDGKDMLQAHLMTTRQRGGAFYYSVDREGKVHHEANGVWRPITVKGREGQIRFLCVGNSLRQETKANDSTIVWWKVIELIDPARIRVETNLSNKAGVYTRILPSPKS